MLEGQWKEGFVAIAAIGATNVGSIRVISRAVKNEYRLAMNL